MTDVDAQDPAFLAWLRDRLLLPMLVGACPAGTTVTVEVVVARRWSNDWGAVYPSWVPRDELDEREVSAHLVLTSDRGVDRLSVRLYSLTDRPFDHRTLAEVIDEVESFLEEYLPETFAAWGNEVVPQRPAYEWPPDHPVGAA